MFTPIAVGEFLLLMLAAGVLLALYRRDPDPPLKYWAVAFGLQAISTVLMAHLVVSPEVRWATGLGGVLGIVAGASMVWGTLRYIGRPISRLWIRFPLAMVALSILADLLDLSPVMRALPIVTALAVGLIFVGVAVARDWRRSIGARVAGLGLTIEGLHNFDYPYFLARPELLPWGHMLATFLEMVICTGFVLLYFERAKSRLIDQQERYRALFENAAVGIFVVDPQGILVAANATLEQLVSPGHSLPGQPLSALFEDPTEARTLLSEKGTALSSRALRWRTRDGRQLDVQVFARRVPSTAGAPLLEGVVVDVTRVEHLQRHLDQVQRAELLGQLAGGIAHDINNVLTVVLANAEVLRLVAGSDPQVAELVGGIRDASQQGAGLTRQLLTFSRRHPTSTASFELGPRVARVARMLQPSLGEDVVLELQTEPEGCRVRADPALIEQLVVNLILNARDAVAAGGKIRVQVRVLPVGLGASDRGGVELEVADTGTGMDRTTLSRVFEPFFSTKEQGTGLGLAVVQRVVKQSAGTLEVDSEPGRGTSFRVHFPRELGPADSPPLEPLSHAGPGGKARVLVVEDRADVRVAMVGTLEAAGFEVISTPTSSEAIARIREGLEVELLITDVRMPEHSGPAVAAELRARRSDVPVLFVSGYSDESALAGSLGQQRTHFLSKPFAPEQLVACARKLVATPPVGHRAASSPPVAAAAK
ncbi:MAG: sensory box histidine kinase/response regulator [Myxococcaceae bacterium]|nr:sensory box histidine kinase/response regulator [Myxococcaceae bacterium]